MNKPITLRPLGWAMAMCFGMITLVSTAGCASHPSIRATAQRYRIEVDLDPPEHRLVGRAVLDMALTNPADLKPGRSMVVNLKLHSDLQVTNIDISGAEGTYVGWRPSEPDPEVGPKTHLHRVELTRPAERFSLFVDYEGKLEQDVSAGEVAGQIHNMRMHAHVSSDGIYLAGGYWYPQPSTGDDKDAPLSDFVLIANRVEGLELVASGERDVATTESTGRLTWHSPYPLDGMVLVGGPHEIHEAMHGDTVIRLYLKPTQAKHAEGLFESVRRNLDRYEPLIGPYPAKEFAVVDNFFSSGFAFPTFTLLSSAVIDMGERSQTAHGYIDHEMLHCWWGNGVLVDPADGDWCEALASYGANYQGYVLDGKTEEARRKRRNYSHFLSRIKPEKDKPLGTFGEDDGCSRGIAYQKGAMVFHMLAQVMGQETFWSAMRTLTRDYVGRHASWEEIRRVCEDESGLSLAGFFDQWVRRGGAPTLVIEGARYDAPRRSLTVDLSQGESSFELNVPIRIAHAQGTLDVNVPLAKPFDRVTVPLEVIPETVELDPEYHIFRKVPSNGIVPTTSRTRSGSAFVTVLPDGGVQGRYKEVQSVFESSFEKDERVVRKVGDIENGALAERCALILGEAVRDSYVGAFLDAIEFPVRFTSKCFEFDGVTYSDPGYAVLCTAVHPGVDGGGVTVLFANSEEAIPPAMFLPMYDRSMVIFKDGRPILRRDFERRNVVTVR